MKIIKYLFFPFLIFVCSCYSQSSYTKKLDKQFGKGTYIIEEAGKKGDNKWKVTLNDYPDLPFYVGRGIQGLPFSYSTFDSVFREAIYKKYCQNAPKETQAYTVKYEHSISIDLKREINISEADHIYDQAMKLVDIINKDFPIYKTIDSSIYIGKNEKISGKKNGEPIIFAKFKDNKTQVMAKEDFIAIEKIILNNKTKKARSGGVIIGNRQDNLALGVDTLEDVLMKGFYIQGISGYSALEKTVIAPGATGAYAWCEIYEGCFFRTLMLGNILDAPNPSKVNYIYIETKNIKDKPCALKDTVITKITYHIPNVEKLAPYGGDVRLDLDGEHATISRLDEKFDLYHGWDIPSPKTKEEKENGVPYKNILIKAVIHKKTRNNPLAALTGSYIPTALSMDVEFTLRNNK